VTLGIAAAIVIGVVLYVYCAPCAAALQQVASAVVAAGARAAAGARTGLATTRNALRSAVDTTSRTVTRTLQRSPQVATRLRRLPGHLQRDSKSVSNILEETSLSVTDIESLDMFDITTSSIKRSLASQFILRVCVCVLEAWTFLQPAG